MNKEETIRHRNRCAQLLEQSGACAFTCHARAYYCKGRYAGVSFSIPHDVNLVPFPRRRNTYHTSPQFVGLHDSLVVTFSRPVSLDNIVRVSDTIPSIPPFGRAIWLGPCLIKRNYPEPRISGWRMEILRSTWEAPESYFAEGRLSLTAIAHQYNSEISLLEFPALTRELFDICIF